MVVFPASTRTLSRISRPPGCFQLNVSLSNYTINPDEEIAAFGHDIMSELSEEIAAFGRRMSELSEEIAAFGRRNV